MQGPPKFSSFRPKTAPVTATPLPAASKEKDIEKEHRKEHRGNRENEKDVSSGHRRHRANHRHEHHGRHDRRSPSRKEHRQHDPTPAPIAQEEHDYDDDLTCDLFVIDRRGDINNLKYGCNEKYKVPTYREPSVRKLLGDRGTFEQDRGQRRSLLASLSAKDKQELRKEVSLVTPSPGQDNLAENQADFITLKHGKKRRRLSRDVVSHLLTDRAADDSMESSSSEVSEGSEENNPVNSADDASTVLRAKKIRLARLVKDEPADVNAWLQYIDFQNTWAHQGREIEEFKLPRDEQHSLAEVRLSIYQKALSAIAKTDPQREHLLIGMMVESELVLESAKLEAKWQQVILDNPGYLRLRQRFLEHSQTESTRFDYNECREKCIDYFAAFPGNGVHDRRAIHAILRTTAFMSQAGFREHAIAIWQVLFELHCSAGSNNIGTADWQAKLDDFERFWDSEKPRFGDVEISVSLKLEGRSDPTAEKHRQASSEALEKQSHNETVSNWLRQEERTTMQKVLPGTVIDQEDDDDLYHIVLFDDIRPFLLHLSYDRFPSDLVNAFLRFMQLPPLAGEQVMDLASDQFLRFENLDNRTSLCKLCNKRGQATHNRPALPHFQTITQTLFAKGGAFTPHHVCRRGHSQLPNFVLSVLKALVSLHPDWTDLAEYYLAFTLCEKPSVVRKEVKLLIKSSPSCLRLYNVYGLIEIRAEHQDKGTKAIRAAISMSNDFDEKSRFDLVHLWHTLVWEAISARMYEEAWQHLLSVTKTGAYQDEPGEDITVAEHYFNTGRQSALDQFRNIHAALHSTCLCLLYYMSSSRNISTALEAFATQIAILSSYGPSFTSAIEAVHQSQAALVEHHVLLSQPTSYVPAIIRSALQNSIASFPSNTTFLSLYAETEARNRLDDRVRQITRDILSQRPSISTAKDDGSSALIINVFAIETELKRAASAAAGSTRHAVRAAFERAIADKQCKHNGTIWSMYLDFELNLLANPSSEMVSRDEGVQRVKTVVHRGLQCLPWVKVWYMRGVEVLVGLGEEDAARDVIRLMVNRGLRVCHEFDG